MRECVVFMVVVAMIGLAGCSGRPPGSLGVDGGKLRPCPDSPNCVSSMEYGGTHYIEPYVYGVERERARTMLLEVLREQRGVRVIAETEEYIYAEFRSALLGFVDDVEFYFSKDTSEVDIRSASRLGYWDMGANRRRMEKIRDLFNSRFAR